MIKKNTESHSVDMMCRLLSVSCSGYYAWYERPPSWRRQRNEALKIKIKHIFDEEKSRAGAQRISKRLTMEGDCAGRHCVAKIMRANGWRAKAAKKYKATTNSNHRLPVSPNLLQQNFEAAKANEKWVSDITYSVPGVQGEHRCSNEPRVYLKYPETDLRINY